MGRCPSDGAGRYLRDDTRSSADCVQMQAALEVIVDWSKSVCHHSILSFIDLSIRLQELADRDETLELVQQRAEITAQLELERQALTNWVDWMRDFARRNEEVLGGIDEPEVLALRDSVTAAETWLGENENLGILDYADNEALRDRLLAVPPRTRYAHGAFYYSDQFIRRLADEMLFLALRERIHVRVRP